MCQRKQNETITAAAAATRTATTSLIIHAYLFSHEAV